MPTDVVSYCFSTKCSGGKEGGWWTDEIFVSKAPQVFKLLHTFQGKCTHIHHFSLCSFLELIATVICLCVLSEMANRAETSVPTLHVSFISK